MFLFRAAGLVLMAILIGGCQQPQAAQPPMAEPTGEEAAAALAQSWRASHPGTEVGVVNAVLPARRELSVAGLPPDRVQAGNVVTILLNGQGSSTVEAVVIDKNRGPSGNQYVQLVYQPLGPSQRDPHLGDLAVWFPGGESIAMQPAETQPTMQSETQPTAMPAEPPRLPPATQEAAPAAPAEAMPPATQPTAAPETQPAAMPETQPAATEPAPAGPPTTTETPTAPPQEKPPAELNK